MTYTGEKQTGRNVGRTDIITVAAGATVPVNGQGRFLRCVSSTGDLRLHIDNSSESMLWNAGKWFRCEPGDAFNGFILRNEGASAATVTIYIGFGNYGDDLKELTGSVSTEETPASTIVDAADDTIAPAGTKTIAANVARRGCIVQNLSSTVTLRIGAAPAANRGLELAPKEKQTWQVDCEIKIYNPGAANADVAVVELE